MDEQLPIPPVPPPKIPPPPFLDPQPPFFTRKNIAISLLLIFAISFAILLFGPIQVLGFLIVVSILFMIAYGPAVESGRIKRSYRLEHSLNVAVRTLPFLSIGVLIITFTFLVFFSKN